MNPTPESIRAARAKSGLSQARAASLIGYACRSWEDWEAGRRKMRRTTLAEFVRLVGVMRAAKRR